MFEKYLRSLFLEDAEGDAASKTRKYIRRKFGETACNKIMTDDRGKPILTRNGQKQTVVDYLERQVRDVFFHNNYANIRFEPGVARIAFDDLDFLGRNQDSRGIEMLKSILKVISSSHVNEYNKDLNGLSFDELSERFNDNVKSASEEDYQKVSSAKYEKNDSYDIVEIPSYTEAKKYYKYTNPKSRWCITHMKDMWETYTAKEMNRVYFVLKKGFETMKPAVGDKCPLDEYGLSMICVIVTNDVNDDERPTLCTCTCRWNHENGGSDTVMDVEQISNVIGESFYSAFKPFSLEYLHSKGLYTFREKLEKYKITHDTDVFDYVDDFIEGRAMVELNGKHNFIDEEGNFISKQWFDDAFEFIEGRASIELNGKWNFIDKEGNILFKQWFDSIWYFSEGYARVELNGKHNFIDEEGNNLSKQWFDYAWDFNEGRAMVRLKDKWNFIDEEGNIISKQWFDHAADFIEGRAMVELNGKHNFIDEEGNFISKQWFDDVWTFKEGYARVKLKDKKNFIDKEGNILFKQWFDNADDFSFGTAGVKLNGEWLHIDRNGKFVKLEAYHRHGRMMIEKIDISDLEMLEDELVELEDQFNKLTMN